MNIKLFLVISLIITLSLPLLIASVGTALAFAFTIYIGYGIWRLQRWMVESSRKLLNKEEK